ncbi:MAG: methylamine utilization protein [Proteobacteria bacterium]|nr:methylamine utilization protein [Pseudomonadota bacterium]
MGTKLVCTVFAVVLLAFAPAIAGTVDIEVVDGNGRPAANTVIALSTAAPADAVQLSRLPAEAIIDQRAETFLPLVSVIRRGGRVIFTNHDTTIHQVYSFSPIKQFEFEIDEGQRSAPVVFDKAGVASVGCNIHDHMITYVYVADTPWTVMTDSRGHATIADIPAGRYRGVVWNPNSMPGSRIPDADVNVTNGETKLALAVQLLSTMPGMKHMHRGSY